MNEQTNSKQTQTKQYEPFHIFSRSKNSVSPVSASFSLSISNTPLKKFLSLSDNPNSRFGRRQRVKHLILAWGEDPTPAATEAEPLRCAAQICKRHHAQGRKRQRWPRPPAGPAQRS